MTTRQMVLIYALFILGTAALVGAVMLFGPPKPHDDIGHTERGLAD